MKRFFVPLLVLCSVFSSLRGYEIWVPSDYGEELSIVDSFTFTVIETVPLPDVQGVYSLAFLPDGTKAYLGEYYYSSVTVIDTETKAIGPVIPVPNEVADIAITNDGSEAYVACQSGTVVPVIDTKTNTVIATITIGDQPSIVQVAPDTGLVYMVNNLSGSVSVIAPSTKTVISTITVGGRPIGLAILKNGSYAYVSNLTLPTGNRYTSVIDTTSLTVVATITTPDASVFNYVASLDNTSVYGPAVGLVDTIRTLSTATNTIIATTTFNNIDGFINITPENAYLLLLPQGGGSSLYIVDRETLRTVATVTVVDSVWTAEVKPSGPLRGSSQSATNVFLTQAEILNKIRWDKVTDIPVTVYNVYRDADFTDLITSVPAEGEASFIDHNLMPNTTYHYYITAEYNGIVVNTGITSVTTGS